MNYLYLLSQNTATGYDTYDSIIVCAPDEQTAKQILPSTYIQWEDMWSGWCKSPKDVTAELIGEASPDVEVGVILASFNAG